MTTLRACDGAVSSEQRRLNGASARAPVRSAGVATNAIAEVTKARRDHDGFEFIVSILLLRLITGVSATHTNLRIAMRPAIGGWLFSNVARWRAAAQVIGSGRARRHDSARGNHQSPPPFQRRGPAARSLCPRLFREACYGRTVILISLRRVMALDITSCLLLSAAAFSGALVSGFAGFAFSAVAGSVLLRVFPPMEAVPLMML